jgi:hypothetical protein
MTNDGVSMRIDLSKSLAATAVAALTVTGVSVGLVASPASAAGSDVVLVSLYNQGHDTSTRYDGVDNAVTLTAMRLDPTATVTFEYNPDPNATDATAGWTAIGGTPTVTGDFVRLTWAPDPTLVGTRVAVRAVADVSGTKTYSTRNGVTLTDPATGPAAVSFYGGFFAPGDPTQQGFFDQPYAGSNRTATRAAVTAYTSATSGTGQLSWWRPSDQTFQGTVQAQVEPYTMKVPAGGSCPPICSEVGAGTFHGDLDITAFDADAGDVIAVGAELDTDDVLPMTLYAQQVTSVFGSAEDPPGPGQPAPVTVTVVDQNNRPVAGAEVRRLSDGSLVGYSDGAGEVHLTMFGGQSDEFYVNTTDVDGYDNSIDKATGPFTPYTQVPTIQAVSVDGAAFDDDEYAAGDLRLQVVDQFEVPMALAGENVDYRLYPTGTTPPATYTTGTTDAQGRVPVTFSPAGPDGGYTLEFHQAADPDKTFVFTAGDSTLTLAPAAGVSSPGGQIGYTGTLSVAGKPLPGRRVDVTYSRGLELFPGHVSDAGLVSGAALVPSLVATTDAQGHVTFVVDDPAEKDQGAETGGALSLSTLASAGTTVTGNPAEKASGTAAFGSKKGKAKLKLTGSSAGAKDKLVVKGPDGVAGEKVKFFRVVAGKLVLIKTKELGKKGDTALKVADTNGAGTTTYVVKLVTSDQVKGSKSKKLNLG